MNELEKERILQLVAQGVIKPGEAASLLAALSEPVAAPTPVPAPNPAANGKAVAPAKPEPAKKPSVVEVDMKRPDGSHHKVEVPSNLFPMFWAIASESVKESTKLAVKESWQGLKNIVRNKTTEVKEGVKTRIDAVQAAKKAEEPAIAPGPSVLEEQREAGRKQILQMVQNGRLSADDAGRLMQQLDAHFAHEQQTS